MKEISELDLPDDVRYSDDHEWARMETGVVRVGITDYAQDRLGDITYVEMPEIGNALERGEEFGTLESTKAASEMLIPVSGKIVEVNTALEESPELVNESPYGDGWMITVEPSDPADLDALMSKEDYIRLLEGMD